MLSYINGVVKSADEQRVIVDLGPLALSCSVANEREFVVGKQALIHTYMHWNQEQGPSLYGFVSELDRTVFLLIISCSGLGPKIGLAVLGHMGPKAFLEAVQTGNEAALSKVSGIGQKKAEQIVVQLRHKVAKLAKDGVELGGSGSFEQWNNVSEVLASLNYSRPEITQTMKYLGDTYGGQSLPFDQLMRHALSFLSKRT